MKLLSVNETRRTYVKTMKHTIRLAIEGFGPDYGMDFLGEFVSAVREAYRPIIFTMESDSDRREFTRNEEKKLLKSAREGDQEAFERLVLVHRDRVIALAFNYLKDREEALDAAQDVFFKAYRNLHRFRGESAFSTWLYRITSNLCRDRLRQKARRPAEGVHEQTIEADDGLRAPNTLTPRESAEESEMEDRILEAVDRLPPAQREVILLREIAQLSYKEIAEAVRCRPGTVMSRLFHARKTLAEELEPLLQNSRE